MSSTLDAGKYWADRAASYRASMDAAYHRNRMAMVDALLREGDLAGDVLDFGCGDGVYAERVVRQGGSVEAIDLEASMVEIARDRLGAIGRGGYVARQGGVEALPVLPEASFDTVLALNVLAYLSDDDTARFYTQAARVLRPGGVLVVTHSNELFDLYTLNKYTAAFFERHFATHAPLDGVRGLLTYPDQPQRSPLPQRANPLSYAVVLRRFGFEEQRQEFAILHPRPPLLMAGFNPDDIAARECPDTLGWADEERWKLMFMCSIFGSRAVRRGAPVEATSR